MKTRPLYLTHGCCDFPNESFNQAALRVPFKPENMPWSAQAKQIPARFICVYVSVAVLFTVFARFNRCLNLLQNTAACTGAKLFCIWNFCLLPFLASVSRPQGSFVFSMRMPDIYTILRHQHAILTPSCMWVPPALDLTTTFAGYNTTPFPDVVK